MKKINFTQKIIFRFLIIVLLMVIILGSVCYIAFIKADRLADELNQALLLDMFLDETIGSHRKWINDLTHYLLLGRKLNIELDPHDCDFGQWYYSFQPPDEEVKKIHENIEEPHQLLHQSVKEILQLYSSVDNTLGHILAHQKNAHLNWIYNFYKAIELKDKIRISSIPIEPTNCAFGKWYTEYTPEDKEMKNYLHLLSKPHQDIHDHAKEIKRLCLQGQWNRALQLFKRAIFPANEKFLKHFSALETFIHQRIKNNKKATDIYISQTVTAMKKIQRLVDEIRFTFMNRITILEKQYQSLVKKSKHFIIFSILLTLLLSILYSFFIPRSLTKPIRRLTDFANRIATEGNLSETITMKNQDEIGQLATSFNKMIRALQKSKMELETWGKTLEKRVQSRTKDLQEAYLQLEKAQTHLIQSSKLASLGELAAGMAHEINNPMTVIINYAELLLDEYKANAVASEYCQGILKMGFRINEIIKNLLTFARQDNQKCAPSSVSHLIDEVFGLTQKRLEKEGIRVEKRYEADLPFVFVRRNQLEQVFLNLIMNAKDALVEKSGSEGEKHNKLLLIQAQKIQKESYPMIRISFRDNGAGIKQEYLNRVFDPFFTTKRRDKGTGLGLSISYGIIKNHQGSIHVKSQRGVFTEFVIELPVEQNFPCRKEQHEGQQYYTLN